MYKKIWCNYIREINHEDDSDEDQLSIFEQVEATHFNTGIVHVNFNISSLKNGWFFISHILNLIK